MHSRLDHPAVQVVTVVSGATMLLAYGVLISIFVLKFKLPGVTPRQMPYAGWLELAITLNGSCCMQRLSFGKTPTSMLASLWLPCAWLRCSSVAASLRQGSCPTSSKATTGRSCSSLGILLPDRREWPYPLAAACLLASSSYSSCTVCTRCMVSKFGGANLGSMQASQAQQEDVTCLCCCSVAGMSSA